MKRCEIFASILLYLEMRLLVDWISSKGCCISNVHCFGRSWGCAISASISKHLSLCTSTYCPFGLIQRVLHVGDSLHHDVAGANKWVSNSPVVAWQSPLSGFQNDSIANKNKQMVKRLRRMFSIKEGSYVVDIYLMVVSEQKRKWSEDWQKVLIRKDSYFSDIACMVETEQRRKWSKDSRSWEQTRKWSKESRSWVLIDTGYSFGKFFFGMETQQTRHSNLTACLT